MPQFIHNVTLLLLFIYLLLFIIIITVVFYSAPSRSPTQKRSPLGAAHGRDHSAALPVEMGFEKGEGC